MFDTSKPSVGTNPLISIDSSDLARYARVDGCIYRRSQPPYWPRRPSPIVQTSRRDRRAVSRAHDGTSQIPIRRTQSRVASLALSRIDTSTSNQWHTLVSSFPLGVVIRKPSLPCHVDPTLAPSQRRHDRAGRRYLMDIGPNIGVPSEKLTDVALEHLTGDPVPGYPIGLWRNI